jgi:GNAT superfamily N-acetyltransferase
MISIRNTGVTYSENVAGEYYIGLSWDYCYKIYLNGRQIGIMFLCEGCDGSVYGDSDCIYIQWVEIQESERGKGYMKDVIESLMKEFSKKHFITAQSSDDHLDMYLHLGFESTGRDPCTFYEMSNIRRKITW